MGEIIIQDPSYQSYKGRFTHIIPGTKIDEYNPTAIEDVNAVTAITRVSEISSNSSEFIRCSNWVDFPSNITYPFSGSVPTRNFDTWFYVDVPSERK